MANVIDEMVIKLSFDIEGLKKRAGDTDTQLKQIRESAEKTGKDMEQSGKRAAQFFSAAKVEALAFMAVLTGGAGLLAALGSTAASMADLGRAAVNLNNMPVDRLDAWGQALKRVGGNAQDAFQSFNAIAQAIAQYTMFGTQAASFPVMRAIGGQTTDTPEQIAMKFSDYIKAHPEKTQAEINVLGQGLGLTQSMINLLRQGPEAVNKELELSRTLGLRTQDMIDTATKFQHDFEALNQAARHLTDRLEIAMIPTADKFVNWLTDFMVANPDTATGLGVAGAVVGGGTGVGIVARLLGLGEAFAKLTSALTAITVPLVGIYEAIKGGQQHDAEMSFEQRAAAAGYQPSKSNFNWWDPRTWGVGREITEYTKDGKTISADDLRQQLGGSIPRATGNSNNSSANSNSPRGIRNNNPLNLEYAPGQGASASDGRFGIYPSMEAGIGAAARQIQRYRDRYGLNTIAGIVGKWAPSSENDTAAYIASVSKAMGIGPNVPLNLDDPSVMSALIAAMSQVENGRALDHDLVQRGVANSQRGAGLLSHESYLLPSAGSRGEAGSHASSNDNSIALTVGTINVHTAATNASGIAKEIHGAISDQMIAQANRGLA